MNEISECMHVFSLEKLKKNTLFPVIDGMDKSEQTV